MAVRRSILFCVVMAAGCLTALAGPVRIVGGPCNPCIPAEPDATNGCLSYALVEVPEHLSICDLDVGISMTNPEAGNLQIFLESPSGTQVLLDMYDACTEYLEGQDYNQTVFDDESCVPIEQAEPPFTGRFRPIEPLAAFDGQDACGTWRLQVYHALHADTRCPSSCELFVWIPEPASASIFLLAVVVSRLRKYSYTC